jgi:hypothetical protein
MLEPAGVSSSGGRRQRATDRVDLVGIVPKTEVGGVKGLAMPANTPLTQSIIEVYSDEVSVIVLSAQVLLLGFFVKNGCNRACSKRVPFGPRESTASTRPDVSSDCKCEEALTINSTAEVSTSQNLTRASIGSQGKMVASLLELSNNSVLR